MDIIIDLPYLSDDLKNTISEWIKEVKEKKYDLFIFDLGLEDHHKKLISLIPFSYLNNGCTRMVFNFEGMVLKIAITTEGITDCQKEQTIYNQCPENLKQYLAQPIDSGYGWILMTVWPLEFIESKSNLKKLIKIVEQFESHDIYPHDILDSTHNVKQKENGDIVIIDYGSFF